MKRLAVALGLLLLAPFVHASGNGVCYGQFPNLVTDICWDCAFPIKLMGVRVMGSDDQEDYDSGSINNVCVCNNSLGVPVAGLHTAFWEFARQADVTRTPYCMVTLGSQWNFDFNANMKGSGTMDDTADIGNRTTFRHIHWYINPAMGLLQITLDSKCLEPKGFDVAYMSELDPTHSDEELERILNPEAYMFGNVVSQLACSADCVSATIGFGSNTLYWCDGCNGTIYPMTGFLPNTYGGVQASSLLVHKLTAKLHRMLTQWSGAGPDGMCGYSLQINMDKRQYKYSMIYPSSQSSIDTANYPTTGQAYDMSTSTDPAAMDAYSSQAQSAQSSSFMRCCQPYGRTTLIWGAGREIPQTGEDFGYAIFRKRDCCQ